MSHYIFEGNAYKYILTDVHVASRLKVSRALGNKNQVSLHLYWKYLFKYAKSWLFYNWSEFNCELTKLIEKYNADVRRRTTKYSHTHTTLVKLFNKDMTIKKLCELMDAQELLDPAKITTSWVKNLNSTVSKVNSAKPHYYY